MEDVGIDDPELVAAAQKTAQLEQQLAANALHASATDSDKKCARCHDSAFQNTSKRTAFNRHEMARLWLPPRVASSGWSSSWRPTHCTPRPQTATTSAHLALFPLSAPPLSGTELHVFWRSRGAPHHAAGAAAGGQRPMRCTPPPQTVTNCASLSTHLVTLWGTTSHWHKMARLLAAATRRVAQLEQHLAIKALHAVTTDSDKKCVPSSRIHAALQQDAQPINGQDAAAQQDLPVKKGTLTTSQWHSVEPSREAGRPAGQPHRGVAHASLAKRAAARHAAKSSRKAAFRAQTKALQHVTHLGSSQVLRSYSQASFTLQACGSRR